MKPLVTLMWFRRDLRLGDNVALYHALKSGFPVIPLFIFDKNILNQLDDRTDRRVGFIHDALGNIQKELVAIGSSMDIIHGFPSQVMETLMEKYDVQSVFSNHDYEPYARERDGIVASRLKEKGIPLFTFKDQVVFEKDEVIKADGKPYTVFTPYSRKWKAKLEEKTLEIFDTTKYFHNFFTREPQPFPSLENIGFVHSGHSHPSDKISDEVISNYGKHRNYPALANATSRLGVHLRFGTISIRKLVSRAMALDETFLNELIWRDFYQMILWQFPQVGKSKCFKPAYESIEWRNDEEAFNRWCEGNTGYPIVDAGMRELNHSGYMHNRVRMIVASFLTKHLLIDWRWGEAYFAQKLLDYDLAANNGGWQWASGSGCDAAPYFRIFNPALQTEKFDKDRKYIQKWVPEFRDDHYPEPMVVHEIARKRALEVYARALKN